MDINNNEFKIKIPKGFGLTHALKNLVENMPNSIISDSKISHLEWDATMDKLIEINNARNAKGENSIFTGGIDKTKDGWQNSFIVHSDQEITFTKDEIEQLFEVMGVTINSAPSEEEISVQEEVVLPIAEEESNDSSEVKSPVLENDSIEYNAPLLESNDSTKVNLPIAEETSESAKLPIIKIDSGKVVVQPDTSKIEKAIDYEKSDSIGGALPALVLDEEVSVDEVDDNITAEETEFVTEVYDKKNRLSWREIGNIARESVKDFAKGMVCDKNGKFSLGRTLATTAIIAGCAIAAPLVATGVTVGLTALGLASATAATVANVAIGTALLAPIAIGGGKKVIEGATNYYSAETKEDAVQAMKHGWDGGVELASIPVMGKLFKWGGKLLQSFRPKVLATKTGVSNGVTEPALLEVKPLNGSTQSGNNATVQNSNQGVKNSQASTSQVPPQKQRNYFEQIKRNIEARKLKKQCKAEQARLAQEAEKTRQAEIDKAAKERKQARSAKEAEINPKYQEQNALKISIEKNASHYKGSETVLPPEGIIAEDIGINLYHSGQISCASKSIIGNFDARYIVRNKLPNASEYITIKKPACFYSEADNVTVIVYKGTQGAGHPYGSFVVKGKISENDATGLLKYIQDNGLLEPRMDGNHLGRGIKSLYTSSKEELGKMFQKAIVEFFKGRNK